MQGLAFTKAHGTGNDFVVIADLADHLELSAASVRALCDRHTGVGADGVLRIGAGVGDAPVFMDYRNADGSIVEMCGNGVRVVAKHVADHGLVPASAWDGDDGLAIATRAGVRHVRVHRAADGKVADVTVDMGPPMFDVADVPFVTDTPLSEGYRHRIVVDDEVVDLAVVSMGNPHAVIGVEAVEDAPVALIGTALQRHDRFPEQVNVGFVQQVDEATIRLRVHERGVGETKACGTAACAAVAVLQRDGAVDERVTVLVTGGTLTIETMADGHLHMTGPAVEVAHGVLDARWWAPHVVQTPRG